MLFILLCNSAEGLWNTGQKNPQPWPLEEMHIIQQISAVLGHRNKCNQCQALTLAASFVAMSKANNLSQNAVCEAWNDSLSGHPAFSPKSSYALWILRSECLKYHIQRMHTQRNPVTMNTLTLGNWVNNRKEHHFLVAIRFGYSRGFAKLSFLDTVFYLCCFGFFFFSFFLKTYLSKQQLWNTKTTLLINSRDSTTRVHKDTALINRAQQKAQTHAPWKLLTITYLQN